MVLTHQSWSQNCGSKAQRVSLELVYVASHMVANLKTPRTLRLSVVHFLIANRCRFEIATTRGLDKFLGEPLARSSYLHHHCLDAVRLSLPQSRNWVSAQR